jgi:hypothetical protein
MYDCLLWFAAGVLIGWLTQIPLFNKFYKEWQDEKLEIYELNKRVLELMKEGKL